MGTVGGRGEGWDCCLCVEGRLGGERGTEGGGEREEGGKSLLWEGDVGVKYCAASRLSCGSLCQHPVQDSLYHYYKYYKQDQVSVKICVTVPFLLLIQTHLY